MLISTYTLYFMQGISMEKRQFPIFKDYRVEKVDAL